MIEKITLSASGTVGCLPCQFDEDEEVEGRILSTEEFIARLRERGDIFYIDNERKLITTEMFSVCCAVMIGLWMSKTDPALLGIIDEGFTDCITHISVPPIHDVSVSTVIVNKPSTPKEIYVSKKVLYTKRNNRTSDKLSTAGSGGGDPRARIAKKGILGILSQQAKGTTVQGEITAIEGYAEGIDAIISGMNSLKPGSGSVIGRRGISGIGFGHGYDKSGIGGDGSGGIDDLIGHSEDLSISLNLEKPKRGKMNLPLVDRSGSFIGGRSKMEVLRVVMQNIQSLRYAYNKRLQEKPGLRGKIICKFAIDEFGTVISCEVIETTLNDNALETSVHNMILRWKFNKIDKPGDITEIVYPFVFSS